MQSVNYLRLFEQGRLNPDIPEHKNIIDANLASMAILSPEKHKEMLKIYKSKEEQKEVVEEPEIVEEVSEEEEPDDLSKEKVMEMLEEAGIEYDKRLGVKKLIALLPQE